MRASPAGLTRLFVLSAFALVRSDVLTAQEASEITTATRVTVRGSEVREFDWAKSHARARVTYTSSGPRILNSRMIDNDLQTSFQFSQSDQSPTVIVELAKSTDLHRISAVFKAEDAELSVYLLNELPKDASDLQSAKPDASVASAPDEHGMASVSVSAGSARYVVLRWKRKRSNDPFTVAEISALSNAPIDFVSDTDPHLAENAKDLLITEPPPVGVISH